MTTERLGASPREGDDALERELRGLLAAEPSPGFLARGRARVAAAERAAAERVANAWWRGWRAMALGGVAAVLVLAVAVSRIEPAADAITEPTSQAASPLGDGVSALTYDADWVQWDLLQAGSSRPYETFGTPAAVPPAEYGMLPVTVADR